MSDRNAIKNKCVRIVIMQQSVELLLVEMTADCAQMNPEKQ